ncbi:MAG: helix-turn-helix domain-containing protein [Eggerthellaceae bacterium]|nr:helix-turn-helix domain-containing protein [Eggerthellaceae bacterium]
MHMVVQWLDSFEPVATVSSKLRDIAGARLFEEGMTIDPAMLYVGRTKDFFPDSASSAVMVMHGNDMATVRTDDLNKVFNSVLTAFDRYDAIERKVELAMLGSAPEQGIVSAFEDLIGPTFIMARDYRILACSQNFTDVAVNSLWDEFSVSREAGLSSIGEMRESEVVTKVLSREPSMKRFRELKAAPYSYGLANTYRSADGAVIGHLIIASDQAITPFEVDIASIIMESLTEYQTRIADGATDGMRESGDALFSKLLAGDEVERSAQMLSALCGMRENTEIRLVRIESYDEDACQIILGAVGRMVPQSVVSVFDGGIVFLAWGGSAEITSLNDTCVWLSRQHPMKTGISNAFRELADCAFAYDQACYALQWARNTGTFEECARDYLLSDRGLSAKRLARHPIVSVLEQVDLERGLDLVATMREYLLCERSVKLAASRLFVHKNTVMYRIGQVKKLDMVDLDDVQERSYVLLSLLV